MEAIELLEILANGEDSKHQFKRNITNPDSLAQEMIAFSNGDGGMIAIGVDDDGTIHGLSKEDVRRLNQMVSNSASEKVRPAINPKTENIATEEGLVMVVTVHAGVNKPYHDNAGVFWVKSGADKRKATAREEIQRLFQSSGLIHADETITPTMTIADLDFDYFKQFFEKRYGDSLMDASLPLDVIIANMNLGKNGMLNLAGALLFASNPSIKYPEFTVKAGSFPGTSLTSQTYLDSRDIIGKIGDIYQQTMSFILSNIRHIQEDMGVNSLGNPEIPRIALEELVANALVHRDYLLSSPIKVFVFSNRVEIISPGSLPNRLTVENIKAGNSNARNPVLASFANHILPYRGYGSGIMRALEAYHDIEFTDDKQGNKFVATIWRK